MENPYDAPDSLSATVDDGERPVGVSILAVLAGLMSVVLLAAFVVFVMNWRENNEYALSRRLAPSLFWFIGGAAVVLAFAASVGIWRGRKWGWWLTCTWLVLFVLQNVLSAATVNFANGAPSLARFTSVDSLKFIARGVTCASILAYWLRDRVRRYFHVEQTSKIKAVALAAACGIGITVLVTVVLQFIFLYRTSR